MKNVALITLIAALAFGYNTQNTVASNASDNAIEEVRGGSVGMNYDSNEETLSLRISTDGKMQRVSVVVMNSNREVVHKQIVVLSEASTLLDIPMTGNDTGVYTLQVKGDRIKYASRFKKK